MQLKYKRRGGCLCVRMSGELDHHSAGPTARELDMLIDKQRIDELILDLDELSFIDSSGLGLVLGRYKRLKNRGACLTLANVPAFCDRLFAMSGVYTLARKIDEGGR